MKKSVLVGLAFAGLSLASASSASAQTATQTIGLSAFVNALCTINGSATGFANNTGVVATTGTATVGGAVTLTGGSNYTVACSTPNTITVSSLNDGLKAAVAGPNTNFINYTVAVAQGLAATAGFTTAATNTPRTVVSAATPTAFNGTMTIDVNVAAQTNLSPGNFSDTLTVTLTPQ